MYCLALITLLAGSCRKKAPEPTIDPATGCSSCTPSNATTFIGIFKAGSYTLSAPLSTSTVTSRSSAYFSTQPVAVPSLANSLTVAAVFFNTDTLQFTGAPYYYTNTKPVNLSSETWSVTGSGNIPSFTFKNLKEKPSFGAISALPDTVKKSIGFNFIIKDLANISAASIYISDGLASPGIFSKALGPGSDTLMFSSNNLISLGTSTNAIITIFMENAFSFKLDGKDFKMSNEASFSKKVVIKD